MPKISEANTINKTAMKRMLVEERKSMRVKQKNSAFMRKTLSIYNGMKKRAKELGREAEIDFTLEGLRSSFQRSLGLTCPHCPRTLTVKTMTFDHSVPIARGGLFCGANLTDMCKSCNWQKGKLTSVEFSRLVQVLKDFPAEAQADVRRRLTIGGKWSFKS